MKYFPLFHRIEGQRCLVIGGGEVALRRSRVLASAGAIIDVISPSCLDELLQVVELSNGHYVPQLVDLGKLNTDYFCIVAATDSKIVNENVAKFARLRNVLVNVVSNRADCDFIFPSIIDRKPLTIAVSNNGDSPVLSRLLREQIETLVPKGFGELSHFVGKHRDKLKEKINDHKGQTKFWEYVIQGEIGVAICSGKEHQAEVLFEQALSNPKMFCDEGEVYLIGAGPGDPDLLTLKAYRLLQKADIVFYDRLVSPEILALVGKSTELINVGKRRNVHAVPQSEINQLLVHYAKNGKRVARLKGGDPFIFGRGGEEVEALVEQGVNFEVIPGITAASGCSAYAGIPLTHRDYAHSVQFVTGQLQDGTIDLNWKELIAPNKTLVFYMGLNGIPIITQSLVEFGMSETMPVALIEKGTTPSQRVFISTIRDLAIDLKKWNVSSPTLLIVSETVQLSSKLNWFDKSGFKKNDSSRSASLSLTS